MDSTNSVALCVFCGFIVMIIVQQYRQVRDWTAHSNRWLVLAVQILVLVLIGIAIWLLVEASKLVHGCPQQTKSAVHIEDNGSVTATPQVITDQSINPVAVFTFISVGGLLCLTGLVCQPAMIHGHYRRFRP